MFTANRKPKGHWTDISFIVKFNSATDKFSFFCCQLDKERHKVCVGWGGWVRRMLGHREWGWKDADVNVEEIEATFEVLALRLVFWARLIYDRIACYQASIMDSVYPPHTNRQTNSKSDPSNSQHRLYLLGQLSNSRGGNLKKAREEKLKPAWWV